MEARKAKAAADSLREWKQEKQKQQQKRYRNSEDDLSERNADPYRMKNQRGNNLRGNAIHRSVRHHAVAGPAPKRVHW
jgi:hypothetical protein